MLFSIPGSENVLNSLLHFRSWSMTPVRPTYCRDRNSVLVWWQKWFYYWTCCTVLNTVNQYKVKTLISFASLHVNCEWQTPAQLVSIIFLKYTILYILYEINLLTNVSYKPAIFLLFDSMLYNISDRNTNCNCTMTNSKIIYIEEDSNMLQHWIYLHCTALKWTVISMHHQSCHHFYHLFGEGENDKACWCFSVKWNMWLLNIIQISGH